MALQIALALAVIPASAIGYETYIVERDCGSGKLVVRLGSGGGPDSAVLLRAAEGSSYSLAMDCNIVVTSASVDHRIVVSIREIEFRIQPDGACEDYLQITRPMCARLLRLDEERHFFSTGNSMEMLYHVSQRGIDNSTLTDYPGFRITATAFSTGACSSFSCKNGFCIWKELRCDSHNNCGDLSDEEECGSGGGSNSAVLVILGSLILVLLLIMCIATLLCSKNESVRRLSNRIRSRTISYLTRLSR